MIHSSFNVIPISLNGFRRVNTHLSEDSGAICTSNSLLDVYANCEQCDSSPHLANLNFTQFATKFKVENEQLTELPPNVVPKRFPTYSSNPKGPNFALYCKYQFLRYKPWKLTQDNAWDDQETSDDIFVTCWHEFLQTPYAETNVPDWFDKLQDIIQNQQEPDNQPVELDSSNKCEESSHTI